MPPSVSIHSHPQKLVLKLEVKGGGCGRAWRKEGVEGREVSSSKVRDGIPVLAIYRASHKSMQRCIYLSVYLSNLIYLCIYVDTDIEILIVALLVIVKHGETT